MAEAVKVTRHNCKDCGKKNAKGRDLYCFTCKKKRKKASKVKRADVHNQNTYGLLPGENEKLLAYSGNTCYICGGKGNGKLATDHDHKKEGRDSVRGKLCTTCNQILLGRIAKDDPKRLKMILENAINYLENPPAREVLGLDD